MIVTLELATYLDRATRAINEGKIEIPLTNRCPECEKMFAAYLEAADADGHLIMQTTADTYAVLVGCEGYWTVNPALLGMPGNNWMDWRESEPVCVLNAPPETNDKGYPACPGSTPDNRHYLCFMERRDLDACPECGTAIPTELKLTDADFV